MIDLASQSYKTRNNRDSSAALRSAYDAKSVTDRVAVENASSRNTSPRVEIDAKES